jgi:RNA ligase (TIGR02306 family)
MTAYFRDGEFGVCSRNLELKEDNNNSFWRAAKKFQLQEKLTSLNKNIALQMELAGIGIQKNPYNLSNHNIYLFDIYDIDRAEYLSPDDRYLLACELDIPHVPIIDSRWEMSMNCTMDDMLNFAEGKSKLWTTAEREGLVFKSLTGRTTFKVISNKFLLKNGD